MISSPVIKLTDAVQQPSELLLYYLQAYQYTDKEYTDALMVLCKNENLPNLECLLKKLNHLHITPELFMYAARFENKETITLLCKYCNKDQDDFTQIEPKKAQCVAYAYYGAILEKNNNAVDYITLIYNETHPKSPTFRQALEAIYREAIDDFNLEAINTIEEYLKGYSFACFLDYVAMGDINYVYEFYEKNNHHIDNHYPFISLKLSIIKYHTALTALSVAQQKCAPLQEYTKLVENHEDIVRFFLARYISTFKEEEITSLAAQVAQHEYEATLSLLFIQIQNYDTKLKIYNHALYHGVLHNKTQIVRYLLNSKKMQLIFNDFSNKNNVFFLAFNAAFLAASIAGNQEMLELFKPYSNNIDMNYIHSEIQKEFQSATLQGDLVLLKKIDKYIKTLNIDTPWAKDAFKVAAKHNYVRIIQFFLLEHTMKEEFKDEILNACLIAMNNQAFKVFTFLIAQNLLDNKDLTSLFDAALKINGKPLGGIIDEINEAIRHCKSQNLHAVKSSKVPKLNLTPNYATYQESDKPSSARYSDRSPKHSPTTQEVANIPITSPTALGLSTEGKVFLRNSGSNLSPKNSPTQLNTSGEQQRRGSILRKSTPNLK